MQGVKAKCEEVCMAHSDDHFAPDNAADEVIFGFRLFLGDKHGDGFGDDRQDIFVKVQIKNICHFEPFCII